MIPQPAPRLLENLAFVFQELLTAGERLRSSRQQVSDAASFRAQIWAAVKLADEEGRRRGYSAEDIELAIFAVVAFLDESILNLRLPVFADWPRQPLQEERYGHHIAGEIFFQNLQKLLGRTDSHELADLLEIYELCLLLGFAGRYSMGGRGDLRSISLQTAEKIQRIRQTGAELATVWRLQGEAVRVMGGDPWVNRLAIGAVFCFVLLVVLFLGFYWLLDSGVGTLNSMVRTGALGLPAAAVFYHFQTKLQNRKEGSDGGDAASEPDQTIHAADSRLAQSMAGVSMANLPAVFVIGDRTTAKTSTILNSGLEPELLAGQIYQDNAIVPTRAVNVFYARGTVFVEAGGALLGNPQAWARLVARLEPKNLKSAGGHGQAPRGVLLCFDLETFARPGASDALANAARYLQARLGEISQLLGISFPVYVLFTRADRLPFFAEFVRNLTAEEAGQVVGATLPMRAGQSSGVYAEGATQRLTAAFNQLFHSFCDQRLRLLPREADPEKVPAAYEFPREFGKLRGALVQFLVDIGRPSQLRASPFLRGFYFSGVRPVVVGGGSRKVPQWLFLGHLFNDVILADEAGRAASGSSVRTSLLKRVLLGSAAALCLLYSLILLISFFGNRGLEEQALTAARNIAAGEAAGANLPSGDALRRLDTLRRSLDQLTGYEARGAPFSLRWGLYSGSAMLPGVRRIYYDKFRQLLFGSTQAQMLAFLQRAPAAPAPSDDYGYAYDTLKSYLMTTSEWKRSSDPSLQAFLGSRLLARWSGGHDADIGKEKMDLAKLQFDFYAHDLHHGNPYSSDANSQAVERSRLYLSKFSGVQRVYQFLLAEAAKRNPPANFNQKFPGTSDTVASTVEVAWAYTSDGWKYMNDQIKRQNFGGELWVLGPYLGQGLDQAGMEKGILGLYTRDYIEQWRAVLRRSNVVRYTSYEDASSKLTLLTGSGAPLLALFWWVSQNTAIDLPGVADKFKAVQTVVPPSGVQQYILPPNQNYNGGLMNLQQALSKAAGKDPDGERATRDQAQSATLTTRQLAATFPPDPEGHIEARAQELLLEPIAYLDGLAGGDLRAGGAAFCAAFGALTKKFPFDSAAQPPLEVTLDELGDILRPKTGKLAAFYENQLKAVMQCQNGECQANGKTALDPAFVKFIGQMMKFSRALYGDAGTDPNYHYSLRPQQSDQVTQFGIVINGEETPLAGGADHAYVWPGTGNRGFRLSLRLAGGSDMQVQTWNGIWAVFRFFADADRSTVAGGGYTFGWGFRQGRGTQLPSINGRPLTYEIYVDTAGGPAVFSKDFLSTLKCVVPVR